MAIQYNYNTGRIIERDHYREMFARVRDSERPLNSVMEVSMSNGTYTASTSTASSYTNINSIEERIKNLRIDIAEDLGIELSKPKEKENIKVIYHFDPEELIDD